MDTHSGAVVFVGDGKGSDANQDHAEKNIWLYGYGVFQVKDNGPS